MNIHHPAFDSVVLPLLVAFIVTGALRLLAGPERGPRLASTAIPVALLTSAALILGLPSWPAQGGIQKLVYIVAGGLLVGLALDVRAVPFRSVLRLAALWLGVSCGWLAWPQLDRAGTWWILGGVGLAGLVLIWRITVTPPQTMRIVVMLLVAAVGLGSIAFASGSLVIAQLSFALAAALGGFALWNWPHVRYAFGAAALLGGGLPLVGLAALTLLLTDAPPWSVAPLVLVFFSDLVSRRLPPSTGPLRKTLEPLYLAVVAAVPVALGIALALYTGQSDDLYYR